MVVHRGRSKLLWVLCLLLLLLLLGRYVLTGTGYEKASVWASTLRHLPSTL